MRYRKKPVIIEAFQFGVDAQPEWSEHGGKVMVVASPNKVCAYIDTPEGRMTAQIGDYIIKGVKGEIYPCKPDIFAQTYEEVKDGE
jgi:hypothetical protein